MNDRTKITPHSPSPPSGSYRRVFHTPRKDRWLTQYEADLVTEYEEHQDPNISPLTPYYGNQLIANRLFWKEMAAEQIVEVVQINAAERKIDIVDQKLDRAVAQGNIEFLESMTPMHVKK